ncbi:peptidase family M50 [Clostridium homopropionicum DSM 5847]|uniref:Peptidase family M50 n=1 Tax=Clostridium homopropionicum DSM 5847 TaxID=1121318 RepID=A0A0L6Z5G3_9CLOT|nr:site-2 protease family protein [Clostridium homopropionicum]KOA18204.1 peptidase family M50 [Clostridium homopropionicum DSM 5847]SFF71331.1 Zn-dependent protease (includes SpoIVFB) [Clostridium homopropionicum]
MFSAENILNTILLIPGILLAFTFHEYAHALVAYKLGDKTPKFQGRLTFNPIAHIDLLGFIMILFFKFGWAKPVQTNPSAFKNYYKDDLKVSVSGVIGNLIAALLSSVILAVVGIVFRKINAGNLSDVLATIALLSIQINCVLFILNLIPVPGFDGFHILRDLFPKAFYKIEGTLLRYQMVILILFIFPIFGGRSIIDIILGGPVSVLFKLFINISGLILSIFS